MQGPGELSGGSQVEFAENWRKRRSCVRCRRIKVRCDYDSPLTTTCRRCTKAGVVCEQTTLKRSHNDNSNDSGMKRSKQDHEDSRESDLKRLAELERLIKNSQIEADQVRQKLNIDDDDTAGNKLIPPFPSSDNEDYLQAVMDKGYCDYNMAEEAYQKIQKSMFFGGVESSTNFYLTLEEQRVNDPLLTITMVTAAFCCHLPPGVKLRPMIKYLEKIVMDKLYHQGQLNLKIIRTLMLMTYYIQSSPQIKAVLNILLGVMITLFLELGSEEEVNKLLAPDIDTRATTQIMDRIRLLITVSASALTMAANSSLLHLKNIIPPTLNTCENVLLEKGTNIDKIGVYYTKLVYNFVEGLQTLTGSHIKGQPVRFIRNTLDAYKKRTDDYLKLMDYHIKPLGEEPNSPRNLVYQTSCAQFQISLNECGLNQMMFFAEDEPSNDILLLYSQEIVSRCQYLNNKFVDISKRHKYYYYPQYMYFRPLKSLTALIRIRLLMWSKSINLQVDIREELNKVRNAWENISIDSYSAQQMHDRLQSVEKWVNLKLQEFDSDKPATPDEAKRVNSILSASTLRKILSGIFDSESINNYPATNNNVQPTANAASSTSSTAAATTSGSGSTDAISMLSAPMFEDNTTYNNDILHTGPEMEDLIRELFSGSTW